MGSLRARLLSWPALVAVVAVAVLAGVAGPRLLDRSSGLSAADKSFIEVCRAHGGTPSLAPGSGDYVKDARDCQIRIGANTYEMYAVHPEGFSEREAAVARRGCMQLAAQARRDHARGENGEPARYVWHARAGVCEEPF